MRIAFEFMVQGHTQVHLKKIEYHEKGQYFCPSFQKVKPIYSIDSLHSDIFQAFISWNVDDYGLHIMKTQNSVS